MNGIPKLLHRWVVVISAPSCVPRVCFRSRPLSLAIFEFLLTHFTPCHARNARRTTGAWPAGFRARVPARIPCCLLCWSITRQRRPTCGDGPQAERRRKTLPPAFPLRLMLAGCGLSLTTTRTRMKTWALASSIKYRLDQWRFQEQEGGGNRRYASAEQESRKWKQSDFHATNLRVCCVPGNNVIDRLPPVGQQRLEVGRGAAQDVIEEHVCGADLHPPPVCQDQQCGKYLLKHILCVCVCGWMCVCVCVMVCVSWCVCHGVCVS